jgi:hypothetical protein
LRSRDPDVPLVPLLVFEYRHSLARHGLRKVSIATAVPPSFKINKPLISLMNIGFWRVFHGPNLFV